MRRKIILTRPSEKAHGPFKGKCFETVNISVTRLVQNVEIDPRRIRSFGPTVCVFTSTKGAEIFLSLFPVDSLPGIRPVAIGDKTAEVLSSRYGEVAVPSEKTSQGINALLDGIISSEDRIVLFSSAQSNGIILKYMVERKWNHLLAVLYDAETLDIEPLVQELAKDDCFGLVLTSSMEANAIFNKLNSKFLIDQDISGKHIFAIGKTTSRTLMDLGIRVSSPVGKSDLEKLLEEIELEYCGQK